MDPRDQSESRLFDIFRWRSVSSFQLAAWRISAKLNFHSRSAIRLVVENASSQPINFLKLTFTDTLSTESEVLLNEAGLDPVQAHMVETELRERPVLVWEQADQPVCIPPGAQQSISIRYFGKFGW